MRITKKMLKRRFDEFNKKYFKEYLTEPKFVITGSRWTAGMFNSDLFIDTDEDGERYISYLGDIKIKLSKYLIKNSKILDNILLHEMIHYYGYYMNEDMHGEHGKFFHKMARKINKDGYKVKKYYEE
jgi:hypothetical protein